MKKRSLSLLWVFLLIPISFVAFILLTLFVNNLSPKIAAGQVALLKGEETLSHGKEKLASGQKELSTGQHVYHETKAAPLVGLAAATPIGWVAIAATGEKATSEKLAQGRKEVAKGKEKIKLGKHELVVGRMELYFGIVLLDLANILRVVFAISTVFFALLFLMFSISKTQSLREFFKKR